MPVESRSREYTVEVRARVRLPEHRDAGDLLDRVVDSLHCDDRAIAADGCGFDYAHGLIGSVFQVDVASMTDATAIAGAVLLRALEHAGADASLYSVTVLADTADALP